MGTALENESAAAAAGDPDHKTQLPGAIGAAITQGQGAGRDVVVGGGRGVADGPDQLWTLGVFGAAATTSLVAVGSPGKVTGAAQLQVHSPARDTAGRMGDVLGVTAAWQQPGGAGGSTVVTAAGAAAERSQVDAAGAAAAVCDAAHGAAVEVRTPPPAGIAPSGAALAGDVGQPPGDASTSGAQPAGATGAASASAAELRRLVLVRKRCMDEVCSSESKRLREASMIRDVASRLVMAARRKGGGTATPRVGALRTD